MTISLFGIGVVPVDVETLVVNTPADPVIKTFGNLSVGWQYRNFGIHWKTESMNKAWAKSAHLDSFEKFLRGN